MEQVLERLPIQSSEPPRHAPRIIADDKAALLQRLRDMQVEGLSQQAMADRLNNEAVPTLSGKGRWQRGTISRLLTQAKGAEI